MIRKSFVTSEWPTDKFLYYIWWPRKEKKTPPCMSCSAAMRGMNDRMTRIITADPGQCKSGVSRVASCDERMVEYRPRAANCIMSGRWRCGLLWPFGRAGKEACSLDLYPGVLLADLGEQQLPFAATAVPSPLMLGALDLLLGHIAMSDRLS